MSEPDYFLMSREWKVVRMRAIERDGSVCACCGRRPGDGLVMNVDHIKPRIRYPELALTLDNMQVLCSDCNHGKGNTYETDWRSAPVPRPIRRPPTIDWELIRRQEIDAIKRTQLPPHEGDA